MGTFDLSGVKTGQQAADYLQQYIEPEAGDADSFGLSQTITDVEKGKVRGLADELIRSLPLVERSTFMKEIGSYLTSQGSAQSSARRYDRYFLRDLHTELRQSFQTMALKKPAEKFYFFWTQIHTHLRDMIF